MGGIRGCLVSRLTQAARGELHTLEEIITDTVLTSDVDARLSPLLLLDGKLHSSMLYQLLTPQVDSPDDAAKFVWKSAAPRHIKFFGWLLNRDRVQSKENLMKKTVVDDDTCELCHVAMETAAHIVFECPFAHSLWHDLGFSLPPGQSVRDLHWLPRPPTVPVEHYASFVLLCCWQMCCWQMWKRRNNIIFKQEVIPRRALLRLCKEDARLWRHMLPRSSSGVAQLCCSLFDSAM
jgi:hypothetical protein